MKRQIRNWRPFAGVRGRYLRRLKVFSRSWLVLHIRTVLYATRSKVGRHTDKANIGWYRAIGFEWRMPKLGGVLRGAKVRRWWRFTYFDPTKWHEVTPILKGRRVSIVVFFGFGRKVRS